MDLDDRLTAYMQGRLTTCEAEHFEEEVANSKDLAAELAALKASRNVLAHEPMHASAEGWDKLSAAIDAEGFKPANDNHTIRFSLSQLAAIVAIAVVGWQLLAAPFFVPNKAAITLASSTVEGPALQITFTTDASLAAVSEVLYQLRGIIVDGPSAIGVYRVRFENETSKTAAKLVLEKRSDLIAEVLS